MLNLVIVGGSGSGKTSLMMRLNKVKPKILSRSDSDLETSICDWKFSSKAGDRGTVYFRMWDFPSQVHHITTFVNVL